MWSPSTQSRRAGSFRPRLEMLEPRLAPSAGELDLTFGIGGKVTTDFLGSARDFGADLVVSQADGKLVVVGNSSGFTVARYNGDGSLDTSFDGDGKLATDFGPSLETAAGVALQSDGKIVVAGQSGSNFALARYLVDGTLDTTFDGDGKLTTDLGIATGVAIQTDGKIVVAGHSFQDFKVARYNSDGSLDTTFDGDGKVTTDFGSLEDRAFALAIQASGKIVVVGTTGSFNGGYDFALARYNADGTLDITFDGDGKVITDFGSPARTQIHVDAVAIQADGKIVVAGAIEQGAIEHSNKWYDFTLARYNDDGSLDTTFDGDGKVTTDFNRTLDRPTGVVIQADGKIIAAGGTTSGPQYDLAIARYNSDGSLDTTFDADGKVTTDFAFGTDNGEGVVLQSDGKIVVAGTSIKGDPLPDITAQDFALARYNPDGSLDSTFDGDGKVTTDFLRPAGASSSDIVAYQADGKLLVVGSAQTDRNSDFALARYNYDGSLDTNFGNGGRVTTDLVHFDYASSVILQPDGRIVVAGQTTGRGVNFNDFALVRYNSDGSLDTSFGTSGKVITDFASTWDVAACVVLQADGKIIVAGTSAPHNSFDDDFALARYNSDGSLDTTFDGDGKVTTDINSARDIANDIVLQADGKIIIAGRSGANFAVARYNTDGSLDNSFDGDGIVTTDFTDFNTLSESATSLAVTTNGKIVVAGFGNAYRTKDHFGQYHDPDADVALARYNSDGSLDTTFDGDGKVQTDMAFRDNSANDLAVLADGRIIVTGEVDVFSNPSLLLSRYNANGSLDASFAGGGIVTTGIAASGGAVAIQSDAKIVVEVVDDFTLVRFHGAPDPDTDGDGIADSVDTQPTTFSNDFSDGNTMGTILARGDQIITIVDAPNATDGVVITTDPGGGPTQARVSVVGNSSTLKLKADQQVTVTRGSVILDVRSGPIEASFLAETGQEFTAIVPTGNVLIFDQVTGSFTAPANNSANIVVLIGEQAIPVRPGKSGLPVLSDIKPGTFPNTINLGSNGSVPVAILSTPMFDATTVDPLTVTLAGAGVNLRGNGTPQASAQDVNGDGRLDLVVHVVTEALELTSGDVQAVLEGQTYGGLAIQGSDTVRVINGLLAAEAGPGRRGAALKLSQVKPLLRAALARWSIVLGSSSLPDIVVWVDDLPGNLLGTAVGNVITVDRNAAGWGWFVDRNPRNDSEFTRRGNQGEQKRMDLLTVLVHEVGHLLGLDHEQDGVMAETLESGTRQTPSAGEFTDWSAIADQIANPTRSKRRW